MFVYVSGPSVRLLTPFVMCPRPTESGLYQWSFPRCRRGAAAHLFGMETTATGTFRIAVNIAFAGLLLGLALVAGFVVAGFESEPSIETVPVQTEVHESDEAMSAYLAQFAPSR